MKIYFCDICNESIPLKDINSNRITIEEGKIFCQKCAPKKVRPGEGVPASVLTMMAVIVLVVVGVGLLGWKLVSDQAEQLDTLQAKVDDLNRGLSDLPRRLTELESRVGGIDTKVQKVGDDLSMTRSELQQRHEALDERERTNHEQQNKTTQEAINRLGGLMKTEIGDAKERISALGTELRSDAKMRIEFLEEKIELLQDVVTSRGGAGQPGSGSGTDPTPKKPAPVDTIEDREVNGHIERLGDPDPGKRYSAVIALGRYTGAKVIKALEALLTDPEDYVRVAVIQNLRKLGAVSSIPHIIGALRDKDYFVRVAARGALRSLTNHKLDYDPDATASERESKVKAWEKWWGDNKEKLVGAAKGG